MSALENQHEVLHSLRDIGQPLVVFRCVKRFRWRKQLDNRTERTHRAEYGTIPDKMGIGLEKAAGIISFQNFTGEGHVFFPIRDEYRTTDYRVGERLGNLRLSTSRHRAWLMAEVPLPYRADEFPWTVCLHLLHFHLVTGGENVHGTRPK